ncbi:MAG: cobyrinate a,c-diamide synthase [Paracoccaceae bacterium]
MGTGLILAAPGSGHGKTTVTLGLLRALHRAGVNMRGAKSGPDYIDPRFHAAACKKPCFNLDAWAMSQTRIKSLAAGDGLLLIEGAMGLFDGAPPMGKGATADLARILNLPVVLIVDAAKMAQSVAPLVSGFAHHDPSVRIAGIILNNVGSDRHETMLRRALDQQSIPVLGAVHRQTGIAHPSRHLGLVQAAERPDLDAYLNTVADAVEKSVDLGAFQNLAAPLNAAPRQTKTPPPAQSIAIAQDAAFAFSYPHLLQDWRAAGATVLTFSPLGDQAPEPADLIILPGGYPELHAAQISAASNFRTGMVKAAKTTQIYGECGGYMVLGNAMTDASGTARPMLGLLPLATSFAKPRLHLGYRNLTPLGGPFAGAQKGHEFHYATTLSAQGPALFKATDAEGTILKEMGLRQGNVTGSFAHIIDAAE